MSIPLERQIACVEREINMRRRCYPRWVGRGSMKQTLADDEIATMEAVLATLEHQHQAAEAPA